MLTSEVLKKAQRIIVEYGWTQGIFGSEGRGFCVLGALQRGIGCTGSALYTSTAYQTVSDLLFKETGDGSLSHYNDWVAKTEKDIVEVFNRAIALAKMRERQ